MTKQIISNGNFSRPRTCVGGFFLAIYCFNINFLTHIRLWDSEGDESKNLCHKLAHEC